jgi:hypothetical protein
MNRDKPDYLLSDEELSLDDDNDTDPYADDVQEELDFTQDHYEREYEPELTIEEFNVRTEEEPEGEQAIPTSAYSRYDSEIDNERW